MSNKKLANDIIELKNEKQKSMSGKQAEMKEKLNSAHESNTDLLKRMNILQKKHDHTISEKEEEISQKEREAEIKMVLQK